MHRSTRGVGRGLGMLLSSALLVGTAATAGAQGTDAPEWVQKLAIKPEGAQTTKYAQQQRARIAAEKELRRLRIKHFGAIKKQEIRQAGILKLREYTDPALYPSLVSIFEREEADVRTALLDMFYDSASPEGDASLTWVGIFDRDNAMRAEAKSRLAKRMKQEGETPHMVKLVTWEGLRSQKTEAIASAAALAGDLKMYDAIPWLINAQVQFAGANQGGGGGDRQGALAWIMVGTQTAFISDLTPVVGPNAVAFDPQLSVITEGVILRVLDAAVVSYNYDIHNALEQLGSAGMDGANLGSLGWNVPAWRDWYKGEFLPYQAKKKADELAKAAAAQQVGKVAPTPASPK